ncbi:MAG: T9SS type A sorting domain-containing protein [Melioribacteraceae bacterium]|nr:T9SS type A sorting domain-containing protein [Melioribacteraceae bacterium]
MKNQIYLFIISLLAFTSIHAQSESEALLNIFNFSNNVTAVTNDVVSVSIDAVWLASEIMGTTTITGTLNQNANNYWTYSASPSDKLILIYSNGSSMEFVFTTIYGYDEGSAEDFKNSHTMDFTTYIKDYLNLRIQSSATPSSDKTNYVKKISGTYIEFAETYTLDIEHTSDTYYYVSGSIAMSEFNDYIVGTANSSSKSYTLNDQFYVSLAHNSNSGTFARSKNRWCNSSSTMGNTSYKFDGMRINWNGGTQFADSANAGIYNIVIDSHQWLVEGSVLKNNQNYGSIEFSEDVINGTNGPYLIAVLSSGETVILNSLLNPIITSIKNEKAIVTNYFLEQNYPNPFNPSTNISFTIPETGVVKLNIYNILGEVVSELINENLEAGFHQYQFNAINLPSGIYFYSISVNGFTKVKKMNLIK